MLFLNFVFNVLLLLKIGDNEPLNKEKQWLRLRCKVLHLFLTSLGFQKTCDNFFKVVSLDNKDLPGNFVLEYFFYYASSSCPVNLSFVKSKVSKPNIGQKHPPKVFYKKGVLRTFVKFTEKHLRQNIFFKKVEGLSLQLY